MELSWCEHFLKAPSTLSYCGWNLNTEVKTVSGMSGIRHFHICSSPSSLPPSLPPVLLLPSLLFLHLHFFRFWDICLQVEHPLPLLVRSRIFGLGLKLQVSEYFLFHIFRLGILSLCEGSLYRHPGHSITCAGKYFASCRVFSVLSRTPNLGKGPGVYLAQPPPLLERGPSELFCS